MNILLTKHNKKTSEVGFTADEKSTEIAVTIDSNLVFFVDME